MTALLASEVRRLSSRRLLRVLAGLAVLAIAVATVIVAVRSTGGSGPLGDRRFHLTLFTGVLRGVSPILIVASWLLGASFIGAEWHAGSLATLMTWEPRRQRMIVAKLIACVAVLFVFVMLIELLLAGGLTLVAALRGTVEGVDDVWVRTTIGVAIRVAALSAMGGALGFAIASIARNTAAALGVGFAYAMVVENLIRALRPQWVRWLMADNGYVFIAGHGPSPSFERTILQAGSLIAAYVGVALVVAMALFRARDVN